MKLPRPATLATALTTAAIGTVAWMGTMGAAPRYGRDTGEPNVYLAVLVVASFAGGYLVPARPGTVALGLSVPGLLLAPWTAPRGDGDGLWVLIFPTLAFYGAVDLALAYLGRWSRA